MTRTQFIQTVLVSQIKEIIDQKYFYHAFLLICSGIEALGALTYFSKPIFDTDRSRSRFNRVLQQHFPKDYRDPELIEGLWGELRCGLLHTFLPNSLFGLTNRDKAAKFGN